MTMDLSLALSDVETVPDFLLDNGKLHAWVDGSEIRGQARYGVYFPHGEYTNISRPVVGPQTRGMRLPNRWWCWRGKFVWRWREISHNS